ncbi:MAG: EthD domain-containing protein [Gammaproteobacteria bacterium]|nr:EthD domain-containing protein [Gammaproteobacteria bacterium]
MIRLTFYVRRKAEMSREEFQSYWLNTHGPLVASHSSDLNILRYVQNHTLDDPLNETMNQARGGEMEPPYDGVAELWWEEEDVLMEALQSEAGIAAGAALLEDENRFIDLANSPLYMAYEYPQVNPTPENIVASVDSDIIKIHFPLRHIESMPEDEVRRYWLTNHGPIIRSHAPASGIIRYLQVHRAGHALDEQLREARGTVTPPYLGHAEVWVDRGAAPTPEAADANRAAIEDESKFIDFKRSSMWVVKEHTIIDRRLYIGADRRK